MSSSSIRQQVSLKLMQDVERAERNIVSKAARKVLQTAEASQCLVLDRRSISALVLGFEAGIGRKLSTYERRKYRKDVKTFFERIAKPFPNIEGKVYFEQILARHNLTLGSNIFFLGGDFQNIKDKYHKFNTEEFIPNTKSLQGSDYDKDAPGKMMQFDHGAQGTAVGSLGGGSAAVAVGLDRGLDIKDFDKDGVVDKNLIAIIDERFNELSSSKKSELRARLFDVIVNWDHVVSRTGGLKAGVGLIIRPVKTKENLGRAHIEKKEMNALLDAIEAAAEDIDWHEVKGSSNLRQKMVKVSIDNFTKPLEKVSKLSKNFDIGSVLEREFKNVELSTKHKVKTKTKRQKPIQAQPVRKNRGGKLATPLVASSGRPQKRTKKSDYGVLRLIGILNDRLPKTVAKNMGSPRLENRTGRFAGSARVTDIAITAKGHPSIGYTYRRDPYEVFEASSGTRFSSKDRDPRAVIDLSIRELAAQQAIGRLFTRRV